jgi:hypothetical protein
METKRVITWGKFFLPLGVFFFLVCLLASPRTLPLLDISGHTTQLRLRTSRGSCIADS